MKRFAFLVLVFAAPAIALEYKTGVKQWAKEFGTDEETVHMCINEAATTEAEIIAIEKQLMDLQDENIDDEMKKNIDIYGRAATCLLEKTEMMKDLKLNVDKIIEAVEREDGKLENKDTITQCLNALNDDNKLTREERGVGAIICTSIPANGKK